MHLRFGRARADRAPRHEVRDVLRRDRIEELRSDGDARVAEPAEQVARDAQAVVDRETLVEVRIVDEAFPADGRARFLEVHAHDDEQRVGVALARRVQ